MNSRTRLLLLVLTVAVALLASGAFAADPKPTAQAEKPVATQMPSAMEPVPIKKVDCVVQGSPVEFPDDLYMKNAGNVVLPKGTKISWAIPNTVRKGTYTLTADLAVGSGTIASGLLPGGHPAGVIGTCSIVTLTRMTAVQAGALKPVALYSFSCQAQGTPTEFPDDIYIQNTGAAAVAKGKVLHWVIPNTTRQGDHTLTEELGAGKGLMLSGVVPGGISAGVKCNVTVK